MPNWVSNRITITGKANDISEFAEIIKVKPKVIQTNEWDNHSFSFHSFITLDEDKYDEYHGTNGWENGERKGDTSYNWYNWNTSNWDTKWDACSTGVDVTTESIVIVFETAWSPPIPVFEAMVEQFPSLEFSIWWEEEQGFGGRFEGTKGVLHSTDQWDIPSCHQDYADKDDEDSCRCNYYDTEEDWYDDCPRRIKYKYIVKVINTYEVEAHTPDSAGLAVSNYENNFDDIAGVNIISYPSEPMFKIEEIKDSVTE